eukprot:scaffold281459_cov13-Tisochrysis_lutea.AAC.1
MEAQCARVILVDDDQALVLLLARVAGYGLLCLCKKEAEFGSLPSRPTFKFTASAGVLRNAAPLFAARR